MKTGAVLDSAEGGIFDVAGMVADDVRDLMGDVRKLLGVENRPKEELVTIEDLFRNVKTAVDDGSETMTTEAMKLRVSNSMMMKMTQSDAVPAITRSRLDPLRRSWKIAAVPAM